MNSAAKSRATSSPMACFFWTADRRRCSFTGLNFWSTRRRCSAALWKLQACQRASMRRCPSSHGGAGRALLPIWSRASLRCESGQHRGRSGECGLTLFHRTTEKLILKQASWLVAIHSDQQSSGTLVAQQLPSERQQSSILSENTLLLSSGCR